MPTYSYTCPDCGDFDAFRSISEFAEPADCPGCGAVAPRSMALPSVRNSGTNGAAQANPFARKQTHGAGCGCCGGGRATAGPPPDRVKKTAFLTRD